MEEGVASAAIAKAAGDEGKATDALAEAQERVAAKLAEIGAARQTQSAPLARMSATRASSFLSTSSKGVRELVKAAVAPSMPAPAPMGSEPVGSYERKTQAIVVLSYFVCFMSCLVSVFEPSFASHSHCLCEAEAPLVTISLHKSDISTPASWSKVAFTEDAAQKLGGR